MGKLNFVLNLFLILILFGLVFLGGIYLYLQFPSNSIGLTAVFNAGEFGVENFSTEFPQFYPNMKFNHNVISYSIQESCAEDKILRMVRAFETLENVTGVISFNRLSADADIQVFCEKQLEEKYNESYFILGEGGAKQIIQTRDYNIIQKGEILLYDSPHSVKYCDWPNVELHELIHVFGFGHSNNSNSLMYPYLESCDQKLDSEIVESLILLYSGDNLPDLYFEKASGFTKGMYLDFNVTIKNSGPIIAKGVKLGVFENEKLVEIFNISDLDFGAGVNFNVQNVKLKSYNPSEVLLFIDPEDKIKELNKNNNKIKLKKD